MSYDSLAQLGSPESLGDIFGWLVKKKKHKHTQHTTKNTTKHKLGP